GAAAFHAALDSVPERATASEKIRLALRAHLAVVAAQLDVATVFTREWRHLEGARRDEFVAERRRYEERIRELFREGVEGSRQRTGHTPGCGPAGIPTPSPIASSPSCSTACAATRLSETRIHIAIRPVLPGDSRKGRRRCGSLCRGGSPLRSFSSGPRWRSAQ